MKGCFVTGTDTEIGKTVVSCAIMRRLASQGLSVAAMKPIASGASQTKDGWRNDDAVALMQEATVQFAYENVNPYCFEPAIAPHLAAEQAKVVIQSDRIQENFSILAAKADFVVVEGVGGWLVPLASNLNVAQLAKILDLPVVLTVGMRLGCINHALLSVAAIAQSCCRLVGWVANFNSGSYAMDSQNINTLVEYLPAPLIGTLPHQSTLQLDVLAGLLDEKLVDRLHG
jgi:dethiobiotin synthetase